MKKEFVKILKDFGGIKILEDNMIFMFKAIHYC